MVANRHARSVVIQLVAIGSAFLTVSPTFPGTLFDVELQGPTDHSPRRNVLPWEEGFYRRAKDSWVPSRMPTKPISIHGSVGHDARVYELLITEGSGSAQLDLDCVQAILGAATYAPNPYKALGALLPFGWNFDSSTPVRLRTNLFHEYYEAHPEAKDLLVLFAIPLDVMLRYPGLFSEHELLSTNNLFAVENASKNGTENMSDFDIAITQYRLQNIQNFYASWQDFFESNPAPTQDQVRKFSHTAWIWK